MEDNLYFDVARHDTMQPNSIPKIMTTSKVKLTSRMRGGIPPGSQPSDVVIQEHI